MTEQESSSAEQEITEQENVELIADPAVRSLAGQLNADLFQELMRGYKKDYEKELARVALIRARITNLCNGDYTPNTKAILAALYPAEETVEYAIDNNYE